MNQYDRAGFQDMESVTHQAASRKGGRIKTKKGFAANPELAKEAGRLGGINASRNRENPKQRQEDSGTSTPVLEAILGDIDE